MSLKSLKYVFHIYFVVWQVVSQTARGSVALLLVLEIIHYVKRNCIKNTIRRKVYVEQFDATVK